MSVTRVVDPYTMELRLCDDQGFVGDTHVESGSPGLAFDADLTYLKLHNNLRARNSNPDTRKPVTEGYGCTGSAHLGGEHIRCTSPAHASDWRPLDAALREGTAIMVGGEQAPETDMFQALENPTNRRIAAMLEKHSAAARAASWAQAWAEQYDEIFRLRAHIAELENTLRNG